MKRNAWLVGTLAVLALALSSTVRADGVTQIDLPFENLPVTNPCNGESVLLSGVLHEVVRFRTDTSGGVHTTDNINGLLTGTGDSTGANYNGIMNFKISTNSSSGPTEAGGTITMTQIESAELIAQGSVPNFLVHFVMHLTINPDGTVTSAVDNFSSTCH